jgi:hypothetical protein
MFGLKSRLAGATALALLVSGCAEEDLGVRQDIFGSVPITMKRTANSPTTPFINTDTVEVVVTLGDCLDGFYASNPEWAPDGEKGWKVVSAWDDVICDRLKYNDVIKCEVIEHTWMPGGGRDGRAAIGIVLQSFDPDVEGFDVRVGPIARDTLAECDAEVEIDVESVVGFTAGGDVDWRIDPEFTTEAWEGQTVTAETNTPFPPSVWCERTN